MMVFPTPRQLQVFTKVAQLGSFRHASAALHMSQSALSQSLGQLETILRAKLFDRTTRSVSLTPVGELFLPRAIRLLAEMELSILDLQEVTAVRRGRIVVSAPPSIASRMLPPLVAVWRERYPNIAVAIRDVPSSAAIQRLSDGECDFSLIVAPRDLPNLAFQPLASDLLRLVRRRSPDEAAAEKISWRVAAREPLILPAPGLLLRAQIDTTLARLSLDVRPAFEVERTETALSLVEAGLGSAVLPALVCPPDDHPHLVATNLVEPTAHRELGLATPIDRSLSPAAETLAASLPMAFRPGGIALPPGVRPLSNQPKRGLFQDF